MGDRAVKVLLEIAPDGREGNGHEPDAIQRDGGRFASTHSPDSYHHDKNLDARDLQRERLL